MRLLAFAFTIVFVWTGPQGELNNLKCENSVHVIIRYSEVYLN